MVNKIEEEKVINLKEKRKIKEIDTRIKKSFEGEKPKFDEEAILKATKEEDVNYLKRVK